VENRNDTRVPSTGVVQQWPAFNPADTGIMLSVLLLLVGDLLTPASRRQATNGKV
jgi:lipoprotein signal peptidase